MNLRIFILAATTGLVLINGCATQVAATAEAPSDQEAAAYNEALAQELGADDYGMSQYVMAFLYAGENRDRDSTETVQLQRAHLKNIRRLADEGSLVLAGPFLDDGELRGIYIFNVKTVEEAQKLTETDPAIQAGSLRMELHPWYGSAGLKQVSDIHDRIQKIKF